MPPVLRYVLCLILMSVGGFDAHTLPPLFNNLPTTKSLPRGILPQVFRLTPPVGTSGICDSGPAPLLCAGVRFRRRPSTIRELNNVA